MDVRVVIHAEPGQDGRALWWAESPDIAGFSATDENFTQLVTLCEEGARLWAEDEGVDPRDIRIRWHFARERSAGGVVQQSRTEGSAASGELELGARLLTA